jgi:hypothetical protein
LSLSGRLVFVALRELLVEQVRATALLRVHCLTGPPSVHFVSAGCTG